MKTAREITITFTVDENLTASDLNELLCLAIHEGRKVKAKQARSISNIETTGEGQPFAIDEYGRQLDANGQPIE